MRMYITMRKVTDSIPWVANKIFLKISQDGIRSLGKVTFKSNPLTNLIATLVVVTNK